MYVTLNANGNHFINPINFKRMKVDSLNVQKIIYLQRWKAGGGGGKTPTQLIFLPR